MALPSRQMRGFAVGVAINIFWAVGVRRDRTAVRRLPRTRLACEIVLSQRYAQTFRGLRRYGSRSAQRSLYFLAEGPWVYLHSLHYAAPRSHGAAKRDDERRPERNAKPRR